jgi:flavin-binding protein dodecin
VPGDGGLNFLLVDLGPAFGATMATMASPKSACGTPMTVGTRNGFNGRFDGGIDVIATRNDEVLGASGNVDVAFRIEIAEVAGDENAVEQASKSLGDLRIAEIVELDMQLDANGKVEAYRSKVKLSFKYEGS